MRKLRPKSNFVWLLLIGLILVAGNLLVVDSLERDAKKTVVNLAQLKTFAGEIRVEDELLTSSALLGAATGDLSWKVRYDKAAGRLDQVLAQAMLRVPGSRGGLEVVSEANERLISAELLAFDDAARGDHSAALKRLRSPTYIEDKAKYASGLARVEKAVIADADASLRESRGRFLLGTYMSIGMLVLISLSIALASRRTCQARDARVQELHMQREKDVAEARGELQHRILSNLNHQMRTPLTGILGMLEMLRERVYQPETVERIEMAERATSALLRDIHNILLYSELIGGTVASESTSVRTADLGSELEQLPARIEAAGSPSLARCSVNLAETLPYAVRIDHERWIWAVEQIVRNALRHAPEGAIRITLDVADPRGQQPMLRCRVEDEGAGFDADALQRVSEAFEIGACQSQRGAEQDGAGLGLPIARVLLEMQSGELELSNGPMGGALATLTVPLTECSQADASVVPASNEASGPAEAVIAERGPPRILVAEDNPINQVVARRHLEALGCEVLVAPDGERALELLDQVVPDLILMDVQMPVMDGLEATRQIRRRKKPMSEVPIVALTANATQRDRELCLRSGMDAHLAKPAEREQLAEALRRYLPTDLVCRIGSPNAEPTARPLPPRPLAPV